MQYALRAVLLATLVCGLGYALHPAILFSAESARASGSKDSAKKSDSKAAKKQVNKADVKALGPLQNYIGSWSGVGAPRRGATIGRGDRGRRARC